MPSKQAEHCIPDRWPCHSVRASPPWTTCSPRRGCSSAGTNIGPIFDQIAGGVVNSAIALAAARGIQKSTGSGQLMNSEEAGQSRSWNTWALWWQRIVYEDGKEVATKFGGAKGKLRYLKGWRRTAFQQIWYSTGIREPCVYGARQRLDHDNKRLQACIRHWSIGDKRDTFFSNREMSIFKLALDLYSWFCRPTLPKKDTNKSTIAKRVWQITQMCDPKK